MAVGILGGTFNPPHLGHLRVAEVVSEVEGMKILFAPSFSPPLKHTEVVSFEHRLRMVELAIQVNPRFWLSTAERELPAPSYTFNLLQRLKDSSPKRDYCFITGIESWKQISSWYRYKEILGLCNFIFVAETQAEMRAHNRFAPTHLYTQLRVSLVEISKVEYQHKSGTSIKFISIPTPDIRSTYIRKLRKEGKTIRYLVPEPVFIYIKEQNLYTGE
jgi:nicotinate-nucleotide adenylyltransferase